MKNLQMVCVAVALCPVLMTGCDVHDEPWSGASHISFYGIRGGDSHRFRANPIYEPLRESDWSLVTWPGLEPIPADVTITEGRFLDGMPTTFDDKMFIEVVPTAEIPSEWYGVLYAGRREDDYETNPAYLAGIGWIWRFQANLPSATLANLYLRGDSSAELLVNGGLYRPASSDDFVMREVGREDCESVFPTEYFGIVEFHCPYPLTPFPREMIIEIGPAVLDRNRQPFGPFTQEFVWEHEVHGFRRDPPPPVPAELCAEGYRYPPGDCV